MSNPHFTWSMAEELALGHMRWLGFADARRTPAGTDGGVDVVSSQAIAQVKHHAIPIGIAEVQRLRGIASSPLKTLYYSSSGYTAAATAWAESTDVALFTYTTSNVVEPVNSTARVLEEHGDGRDSGSERESVAGRRPDLALTVLFLMRRWTASRDRFTSEIAFNARVWFPDQKAKDDDPEGYQRLTKAMNLLTLIDYEIASIEETYARDPTSVDWGNALTTLTDQISRIRLLWTEAGMNLDAALYPESAFRYDGIGWQLIRR